MITNSFKCGLFQLLKRAQVFQKAAESQWRTEKLLILCYHGISIEDEHDWDPTFSMAAPDFETRLALLRSGGYRVLPLPEALQRLYSNTLPRKSVAITFDDGMYNFYACALPVLKKYGFPVTLYLTTYYCYNALPVFPLICSYLLWKNGLVTVQAKPRIGFTDVQNLSTPAGRHQAWTALQHFSEKQRLTAFQKNDLAKELSEHLKLDFDSLVSKRLFHLMSPEEVKESSRSGVEIQLHTHRHRTPMDRLLFQQEIAENRSKIEDLVGSAPQHYCYPSGVHRPQFLPWLSEQGVTSATTCDQGLANSKTNSLLLPRFLDSSNVSSIEFESWLAGIGSFLPRNPLRKWLPL